MVSMFYNSQACHHMVGSDRWADRWGSSRCDNPATRSARGTTSNSMFVCLVYFAVCLSLTTARAVEPGAEILLWPNGAPGSEGKTNLETVVRVTEAGDHVLSNIHKPSITPYLPATGNSGSTRQSEATAVIIAPGGGHRELWSDHEGHNVARWLSDRGIAAFVLKYRLAKETNSTYTVDDHAVADMQRALRLVRSRASEWPLLPTASA
jgi:acetyl esterase/lipase